MGDNISTVEVVQYRGGKIQYCGGYSVHWGITSVHAGDNISTVEGLSTVGDNISTMEVAQYSEDKDFRYYDFQRISKSFPELFSL